MITESVVGRDKRRRKIPNLMRREDDVLSSRFYRNINNNNNRNNNNFRRVGLGPRQKNSLQVKVQRPENSAER